MTSFNTMDDRCRWAFYSDAHDIKFGVLSRDEEGRESVVMPVHRVACHQSEEVGVIACSAPATCKSSNCQQDIAVFKEKTYIVFV